MFDQPMWPGDAHVADQVRASAHPKQRLAGFFGDGQIARAGGHDGDAAGGGQGIVVIGGERNAEAVQRLTEAFELKDAEWVELTEHGPGTPMRAPIYRPDTAVVIVIIKLTGHLHSDEARDYAAAAGKPCVMLSGGYNPERVAAEIMEQASDRLK